MQSAGSGCESGESVKAAVSKNQRPCWCGSEIGVNVKFARTGWRVHNYT